MTDIAPSLKTEHRKPDPSQRFDILNEVFQLLVGQRPRALNFRRVVVAAEQLFDAGGAAVVEEDDLAIGAEERRRIEAAVGIPRLFMPELVDLAVGELRALMAIGAAP